jgi:hypothetical protein
MGVVADMIIDHVGDGLIVEEGLKYMHKARMHSGIILGRMDNKMQREMGHTGSEGNCGVGHFA